MCCVCFFKLFRGDTGHEPRSLVLILYFVHNTIHLDLLPVTSVILGVTLVGLENKIKSVEASSVRLATAVIC